MKWSCPVCSTESNGRICSVCGFEQIYYIGELSGEEKEEQRLKIEIARKNWQELQDSRNQKKAFQEQMELLKDIQAEIQKLKAETKNQKRADNSQEEIQKLKEEIQALKQQRVAPDIKPQGPEKADGGHKYRLRNKPMTVSDDECEQVFGLDQDRKLLRYIRNNFQDNGNGTVTDHATGLMWQKSGSGNIAEFGETTLFKVPSAFISPVDNPMEYGEVANYICSLNRKKISGYADWRLPTVDEIVSLLEPKKSSGRLYIEEIFDRRQHSVWSGDRASMDIEKKLNELAKDLLPDKPFSVNPFRSLWKCFPGKEPGPITFFPGKTEIEVSASAKAEGVWMINFKDGAVSWGGTETKAYVRTVRSL